MILKSQGKKVDIKKVESYNIQDIDSGVVWKHIRGNNLMTLVQIQPVNIIFLVLVLYSFTQLKS